MILRAASPSRMTSDAGAAARLGAVTGMKVAVVGAVVYLLVFLGWYLIDEFDTDPNLLLGAFLVVVVGRNRPPES
jgi:hypothetical protein